MGAVSHLWQKQDVQEASVPWVQWLPLVLLFAHHCGSKAKLTFALMVSLVLRVILGSTNWGQWNTIPLWDFMETPSFKSSSTTLGSPSNSHTTCAIRRLSNHSELPQDPTVGFVPIWKGPSATGTFPFASICPPSTLPPLHHPLTLLVWNSFLSSAAFPSVVSPTCWTPQLFHQIIFLLSVCQLFSVLPSASWKLTELGIGPRWKWWCFFTQWAESMGVTKVSWVPE